MESLTRYIQRFSTALKQYYTKKDQPHVVTKGTFDWVRDDGILNLKLPSVAGIYRFSFINRSSFIMDNSLFEISSSIKTKTNTGSHVFACNNVNKSTTLFYEIELNSIDVTEASFEITCPYNGLNNLPLCYIIEYVSDLPD